MNEHERLVTEFFKTCNPEQLQTVVERYPVLTEGQLHYRQQKEILTGVESDPQVMLRGFGNRRRHRSPEKSL